MYFDFILSLIFVIYVKSEAFSADYWNNPEVCQALNEDLHELICSTIIDKQTCVSAVEVQSQIQVNDSIIDVFGQPCAWCNDGSCLSSSSSRCQPMNLLESPETSVLSTDYTSCPVDSMCKMPYGTVDGVVPLLDCSFGVFLSSGSELCIEGQDFIVLSVQQADCLAEYGHPCTLERLHVSPHLSFEVGMTVTNGSCVSGADMQCYEEVHQCRQSVQVIFDELHKQETPAPLGTGGSGCDLISAELRFLLMELDANPADIFRLCIYDDLDQYYYVIDNDLSLNTCVVHGDDPAADCQPGAGRVCSARARGRSVVGTLQQRAKLLKKAMDRDNNFAHPQCLRPLM